MCVDFAAGVCFASALALGRLSDPFSLSHLRFTAYYRRRVWNSHCRFEWQENQAPSTSMWSFFGTGSGPTFQALNSSSSRRVTASTKHDYDEPLCYVTEMSDIVAYQVERSSKSD